MATDQGLDQGWEVIELQYDEPDLDTGLVYVERHIIPIFNKSRHEFAEGCWCQPYLEYTLEGIPMYVHSGSH